VVVDGALIVDSGTVERLVPELEQPTPSTAVAQPSISARVRSGRLVYVVTSR
jgi:hypothetical protein